MTCIMPNIKVNAYLKKQQEEKAGSSEIVPFTWVVLLNVGHSLGH